MAGHRLIKFTFLCLRGDGTGSYLALPSCVCGSLPPLSLSFAQTYNTVSRHYIQFIIQQCIRRQANVGSKNPNTFEGKSLKKQTQCKHIEGYESSTFSENVEISFAVKRVLKEHM